MQEIRRFKPSTISRRFSVATGFYRTCVIDGMLGHSPAEHVRRPSAPAESLTLGVYPSAVRGPTYRRLRVRQSPRLRGLGHGRYLGDVSGQSPQTPAIT